ncbi:chorismate synthase (plasmid) [Thermovirga lienii DSM 17291]|uniref:Chorismate synthase n=1 Tax=Thermovirga lienii (strain ATCC BAA-1197 / DSM 17291 / Cas60314) TaxID=580340 RepID=G7VAF4_THELD|nr:chorismate synthase [Thermovirga lienii]AER67604.1 chorismate synthase [Thermovirga lienii DSM 17291]
MGILRFLTSGESHGRGLITVVEGLPAGLSVPIERLEKELERRRRGYGRGARMKIEKDHLTIWGGIWNGKTTGAPCGLTIENSEWEEWRSSMDPQSCDPKAVKEKSVYCPRPGHADLPGGLKYGHENMRPVLERASARATAAWTVAGTLARLLIESLGIEVRSAVTSVGGVTVKVPSEEEEWHVASNSPLGCVFQTDEERLKERIREAMSEGDSLGGAFVVSVKGLPPGVGSYVEWDRRLDGRIAQAMMAIPGIKGVEVGEGGRLADLPGSQVHDGIFMDEKGRIKRETNRAGGIEGGMTNGEEVLVRAFMKPIPTLTRPLPSIRLDLMEASFAHRERSDVCAVPAARIVAEAMLSWVIAEAIMEQFGGDILEEVQERFSSYVSRVGRRDDEKA